MILNSLSATGGAGSHMAERSGVPIGAFVSSALLFTTLSSISAAAAESLYGLHQLLK